MSWNSNWEETRCLFGRKVTWVVGMWLVFQSKNLPEDYIAVFLSSVRHCWTMMSFWQLKGIFKTAEPFPPWVFDPCLLGQAFLSLRWSHSCLEYVNFTTLFSIWHMMDNSMHCLLSLLTNPPFLSCVKVQMEDYIWKIEKPNILPKPQKW